MVSLNSTLVSTQLSRKFQPFTQASCPALRAQSSRIRFITRAEPVQTPPKSDAQANEDLPPWARREKERELQAAQAAAAGGKLPWPLALLFSVFVAIAATGSIYEYVDKNPIFGVIQPDSPVWAPILLFMAVTGYPTAGFLFKYGVDEFNAAAELQDRLDGYLPQDRK